MQQIATRFKSAEVTLLHDRRRSTCASVAARAASIPADRSKRPAAPPSAPARSACPAFPTSSDRPSAGLPMPSAPGCLRPPRNDRIGLHLSHRPCMSHQDSNPTAFPVRSRHTVCARKTLTSGIVTVYSPRSSPIGLKRTPRIGPLFAGRHQTPQPAHRLRRPCYSASSGSALLAAPPNAMIFERPATAIAVSV